MTVIPQLGYRGARMIIHVGLRTISLYIFLFIKRSTSIFINNIRLLTYTYIQHLRVMADLSFMLVCWKDRWQVRKWPISFPKLFVQTCDVLQFHHWISDERILIYDTHECTGFFIGQGREGLKIKSHLRN